MYRLKGELIKLLPFGKLRLEVAVHKLKMSFKRLKSCHGKSDISDEKGSVEVGIMCVSCLDVQNPQQTIKTEIWGKLW